MGGFNYDDSCLKDVYDEHLSEDYISMTHAEIFDGTNVQRHNLFCGSSLNGKLVQSEWKIKFNGGTQPPLLEICLSNACH